MNVHAVIAFRPTDEPKLRERMASVPSARLRALKDGTLLFSSSIRFDVVGAKRRLVVTWLEKTFGKDLPVVHSDPRGIAIFPDRCKPKAKTYERLIKELGDEVVWVPINLQPRSSYARGYEGGELVDEVTGAILQTRKHTDAPDNYEAELAALGLAGDGSKSAFDDDDSEEDYDDDDDDEDNDDDRIEDDDELLEHGLDEPKPKSKAKAKAKGTKKTKP